MSLLTVLNFSGGKQSSAILWMVLRGDLPRPEQFLVLTADPGMENSETYDYVRAMHRLCWHRGIEAHVVPGPNLYRDLLELKSSGRKRVDNPPYWTKDEQGKRGKLLQKCTRYYKVQPMDRFLRRYMERKFGISAESRRIGENIVTKWIGYSYSETCRVRPSQTKYVQFAYPLIEALMDDQSVLDYYAQHEILPPPRSVCNACFANSVEHFSEMRANRPGDWDQAVAIDETIRDLACIGVEKQVFVSRTLLPLRELAEKGFEDLKLDPEALLCSSGYCFT